MHTLKKATQILQVWVGLFIKKKTKPTTNQPPHPTKPNNPPQKNPNKNQTQKHHHQTQKGGKLPQY